MARHDHLADRAPDCRTAPYQAVALWGGHPAHPDGADRRRDASDRFRPVDHRVAAAARCHPAARRRCLAGGLRQIPRDPGISHRQCRDDARAVQIHLLVGVGSPLSRPLHRRRVLSALSVLCLEPQHRARALVAAPGAVPARRRPGGARLVHGQVGAGGPGGCQPVPAGGASVAGGRHLRRRLVDRLGHRATPARAVMAEAGEPPGRRPGGTGVRPDRRRRLRCRARCRAGLQHLAADGRRRHSGRPRCHVARLAQPVRECADGAVRPPRHRLSAVRRSTAEFPRLYGSGAERRRAPTLLLLAVLGQVALGIWTLLEQVPVPLGLAHQAGALLVLVAALWNLDRAAGWASGPLPDRGRR